MQRRLPPVPLHAKAHSISVMEGDLTSDCFDTLSVLHIERQAAIALQLRDSAGFSPVFSHPSQAGHIFSSRQLLPLVWKTGNGKVKAVHRYTEHSI